MTPNRPRISPPTPGTRQWIALLAIVIWAPAWLEAAPLRVGIAAVDITPAEPVQMSGYASRKDLSQSVHDPLSARVTALEAGERRLVLVSTDILGFYDGTADDFRRAICEKHDLAPAQLLLCATHTHSAPTPTLDPDKGHENNVRYTRQLRDRLIDAVGKALSELAPAKMGVGVGHCPIGSNRRQRVSDAQGNSQIRLGRNPYGPTDKQVIVLKIAAADKPTAILFNYATHATSLGPGNYAISGDVIGLAEQFVERIYGAGLMAPAFAGASGDIDPWFRVLPKFDEREGWIPEPVLLGTFLGEEVVHVAERVNPSVDDVAIASAFACLELPGKASGTVEAAQDHPPTTLNLTIARIGEIAIVGLGGEVLTEIGMAIKEASPFAHTLIITHCNGAAGYLPPKDLYPEGGYEIQTSRFAPDAAEIVIKRAVEMLHTLKP